MRDGMLIGLVAMMCSFFGIAMILGFIGWLIPIESVYVSGDRSAEPRRRALPPEAVLQPPQPLPRAAFIGRDVSGRFDPSNIV